MTPRVLVACVGNVFLSDDGFGVEVAKRLASETMRDGVRVVDYGIRSVHLAYDLLEGYDALVLVDAAPQGYEPGTLSVLEPEFDDGADRDEGVLVDPHTLTAEATLAMVESLPARPARVRVVACEPASVEEGFALSEPVAAAVDGAVTLVREVIDDLLVEA